jgi:hypothetical protein
VSEPQAGTDMRTALAVLTSLLQATRGGSAVDRRAALDIQDLWNHLRRGNAA